MTYVLLLSRSSFAPTCRKGFKLLSPFYSGEYREVIMKVSRQLAGAGARVVLLCLLSQAGYFYRGFLNRGISEAVSTKESR